MCIRDRVAERLITIGVGVDHLARISADCFALVLSNIREGADVVRFFESQVATALTKPFKLEGQELRISVRAGIAIFPDDGNCLLYTSPSPRDRTRSRMPSSA